HGRRPSASRRFILCGRWSSVGEVLRKEREGCDIQPELSTIHTTRAVFANETYGHQRLEVLFEQRGLAQQVGASLWRVRSPGPCSRTTPHQLEAARIVTRHVRPTTQEYAGTLGTRSCSRSADRLVSILLFSQCSYPSKTPSQQAWLGRSNP